ncbi:hypothetical protein THAOC_22720 [Thalassiosira oceanica]|uniref:UBA domain-containing protein n=1 Tax=Thalassiosira oceanica TaxID=159749 RepID=K0RXT5_THAOC|nr:hypothetical protein THAOC_22720 [Thalassiosira oceanica]|eukprot:EJK57259.1 hypothetical protein THAOC_22720 [Thalassiosira oceanica]
MNPDEEQDNVQKIGDELSQFSFASTFLAATGFEPSGKSERLARRYLETTDGNIDLAVGLYLDSDPRSLIDASYEPDVDTTKKPAAAPADADMTVDWRPPLFPVPRRPQFHQKADSEGWSPVESLYDCRQPVCQHKQEPKIPSTSSGDTMAAKGNQAVDNDELKKLNIVPFFGFLRGGKGRLKIISILMSLDRLLFTRNKNGQGKRSHILFGSVYEGDWENGRYHGEGSLTLKWPSYGVYKGQFEFGHPHGRGKATDKRGNFYDGDWFEGEAHGDCTFKLGWLRYKGEMQKGKINGKGTMKSGRGRYTGAWKDNTMHGVGTYKWPNGSTYAGGFKKDKMHGRGTLKQAHGFVVEGYWKNGNFVGKAGEDYGLDIGTVGTAAETLTLPDVAVGIPVSGSGMASKKMASAK